MMDSLYLFKEDRIKYKLSINEWVVYSWFRVRKRTHDVGEIISDIGIFSKKDTLRRVLNSLVSKGAIHLHKLSDADALDHICVRTTIFSVGCSACGVIGVPLDKHHYPVRKKDGGVGTIDICPNCHRKFHTLSDFGVFALNND